MNYLQTANSITMWLVCLPPVLFVVFAAWVFFKKSMKTGLEMGLKREQLNSAVTSSALASVGPSLVVLFSMLPLIISLGGPVAWIRLNYIGAIIYEMACAEATANVAGTTLGSPDMTVTVFASAVWVMSLCCIPYILSTVILTPQMEKVKTKIANVKPAILGVISIAGMLGIFSNLALDKVIPFSVSGTVLATVAGFVVNAGLLLYAGKTGKAWPRKYGLTIAMIAGVLIGCPFL